MRRFIIIPMIIGCYLALDGCAHLLYRPDIQQGNVIVNTQVRQLNPGMTKAQVQALLGAPVLIDTFNDNRWAYIYTFQSGGSKPLKRQLNVYFHQNRLTHYTTSNLHHHAADTRAAAQPATDAPP